MTWLLMSGCLTGLVDRDDPNDLPDLQGDDPQIVVDPPSIDFGLAGWALSRELTVMNVGEGPLLLGQTVSDEPFRIEAVDETVTLEPGEQAVLTVDYEADTYGVFEGQVELHSDDPMDPVLLIEVQATNPWAELGAPAAVDLGELGVRCESETTFRVANHGLADLEISDITFSSASTEIYVDARNLPWTLAPGQEKNVRVQYEPHDDGDDEGVITLLSNDVAQPLTEVLVFGTATWDDAC